MPAWWYLCLSATIGFGLAIVAAPPIGWGRKLLYHCNAGIHGGKVFLGGTFSSILDNRYSCDCSEVLASCSRIVQGDHNTKGESRSLEVLLGNFCSRDTAQEMSPRQRSLQ